MPKHVKTFVELGEYTPADDDPEPSGNGGFEIIPSPDYLQKAISDPRKNAELRLRFKRELEKFKERCAHEKLEGTSTPSRERYLFLREFPCHQRIAAEMFEEESERNRNATLNMDSRQDKLDFQSLAIRHKAEYQTLAGLKPILPAYFRKYGKGHTLRDWVNEVLPGHLRAGRPCKKK